MRRLNFLAITVAAIVGVLTANAEETTCPADAAATLYQVAAQAGQTTDPAQLNVAYSYAVRFTQLCPEDTFVQFFGAHAFTQVAHRIADPASRLQALNDATRALHRHEKLDPGPEGDMVFRSGLRDTDNREILIDTARNGDQLMKASIAPQIVELEARGQFHDFISSRGKPEDSPCPYRSGTRAIAEAQGYNDGFDAIAPYFLENRAIPNINGAIERMDWLRTTCPASARGLSFEMGLLQNKAAKWSKSSRDMEGAKGAARKSLTYFSEYTALAEEDNASAITSNIVGIMTSEMEQILSE